MAGYLRVSKIYPQHDGNYIPGIDILVKRIAGTEIPIAVTKDIGHGTDSKGILIGKEISLI